MLSRRTLARQAPSFGRRAPVVTFGEARRGSSGLADDARWFALTFVAGFVFMSVYLA